MKRNVAWYPMAAIAATLFAPPTIAGQIYAPAVREMTERRAATERRRLPCHRPNAFYEEV